MKKGVSTQEVVDRINALMTKLNINKEDRSIVEPAICKAEEKKTNIVAIQLKNGKVITGKESNVVVNNT